MMFFCIVDMFLWHYGVFPTDYSYVHDRFLYRWAVLQVVCVAGAA